MGVDFDGGGDEVEDAAALLTAGFDHGQHRFHEAAARVALRAERQLAPDHEVSQGAFLAIVGRFHARLIHEQPKLVEAFK